MCDIISVAMETAAILDFKRKLCHHVEDAGVICDTGTKAISGSGP